MNDPLLVARQRTLLRDLAQRAAARAKDEKLLGQTAPHAKAKAETAFEDGRQEAEAKLKSALAQVERDTEEERAAHPGTFRGGAGGRDSGNSTRPARRWPSAARKRRRPPAPRFQETRWTFNAVLERNTAKAEERRRAAEKRLTAILDRLVTVRREASALWDEWEEDYLHPSWKTAAGPRDKNPRLSLRKSLAALEDRLAELRKQLQELVLPKVLRSGRLTHGLRRSLASS